MISIASMRAAGMTDSQIVKLLEADQLEKSAKRREQNRKAQQNHRSRQQISADSADVADRVNALSLVSTLKEESKKERATGKTIPSDWHPSESHYLEGQKLGLGRADVDRHAKDMKLWGEANRNRAVARKADWGATFTGWLRRTAPKTNGDWKLMSGMEGIL